MTDQKTILGLLRLGWSARRVARQTGHRRETVARYGIAAGVIEPKVARAAEVATDSRPQSEPEIQPKPAKVATDSVAPSGREVVGDPTLSQDHAPSAASRSRSNCEVHRAFIDAEINKGRNAVAIYQDLDEHHGYAGAYNAVKRFVGKSRSHDPKISCRFESLVGQEAQVDYGEGAPTRDSRTGKFRKPRLFVITLGFSRHTFRKAVWKSSSQTWCELHEEAFAPTICAKASSIPTSTIPISTRSTPRCSSTMVLSHCHVALTLQILRGKWNRRLGTPKERH